MEGGTRKILSRDEQIIRASVVGIAANVLLSAAKGVIGLISSSIAITLDAVNNLTDALSAVITLVGTKLAMKPADKTHPYGHGRFEYLTTIAVAFVIILAGLSSLVESFERLLEPEASEYSLVSLALLTLAIATKLFLSRFYSKAGKRTNSEALKDSGLDARFDAVITSATLLSAIAYMTFGQAVVRLDGAIGLLIAAVIIRAGIKMVISPLDGLLGAREDHSKMAQIKADIERHEGVLGTYDMMLHDYGPQTHLGDVHIAVRDDMSAHEIHDLSRRIQNDILEKYNIFFTIGIYAENYSDPASKAMYDNIKALLMATKGVLQVHGLYIDPKDKTISFDAVVEFADHQEDYSLVHERLSSMIKSAYPDYSIDCYIDKDYSISE